MEVDEQRKTFKKYDRSGERGTAEAGICKETVRLYYPVDSLNTILGSNAKDDQEMLTLLRKAFGSEVISWRTSFYSHAGRVEISIPPEGSQWVHEQVETPAFSKRPDSVISGASRMHIGRDLPGV